jgi:hypothetical protein
VSQAAYLREWRRRNPERVARHREQHAGYMRGLRHSHSSPPAAPLPPLLPELRRGIRLSFWDDELRLDLFQERQLAILEGRDPEVAVKAYRSREETWLAHTVGLVDWA